MCSGPVVNYRTLKTSAQSKFRGLMRSEFEEIISSLVNQNAGSIEKFRTNRSINESIVFIKKTFHELPIDISKYIEKAKYEIKYNQKINKLITSSMRNHLHLMGFITEQQRDS